MYGDPSLYQWSQGSGYVVGVAAQVVLTGGAGAVKSGVTSVAKVVPRLVTDLPGVLADAGSAIKTGVAALKNVPQLVSGLPRAVASAASELGSGVMNTIRAPGEAISALRAGLNNPWDTVGGIFGTPASAASASETATAATTTADAAGSDFAAMDSFLDNGSTVHHSTTATAIGDDVQTINNFDKSFGAAGHDVIVHSTVAEDGSIAFSTNGMPTNVNQIAQAVLDNPDYVPGTPIQLVTCHGACGLADDLSAALGGTTVTALDDIVDLDPFTGLLRGARDFYGIE